MKYTENARSTDLYIKIDKKFIQNIFYLLENSERRNKWVFLKFVDFFSNMHAFHENTISLDYWLIIHS